MIIGFVDFDREKGSRPDMQGQDFLAYACHDQRGQQTVGEMQRCRRRRHGTFFPGKHRLIVIGIALVDRPLAGDIGR